MQITQKGALPARLVRCACPPKVSGILAHSGQFGLLLSVDLQVDDNVFLVIEAGDGSRSGFQAVFFSVELVIDIGIETAEAVVTLVVRDVAAYRVGVRVFEKDDG